MLATDVDELRHAEHSEEEQGTVPDQNDRERDRVRMRCSRLWTSWNSVLRENAESERLLSQRIAEVRLARENGQGMEDHPRPTRTSPEPCSW